MEKRRTPDRKAKPREKTAEKPREDAPSLSTEQQELIEWLKTVKFKPAVFGGVNESDVWKKLEQLNRLYEAALIAERARYNALLAAYVQNTNAKLDQYRQALNQAQNQYNQLAQAYNSRVGQNKERESDG